MPAFAIGGLVAGAVVAGTGPESSCHLDPRNPYSPEYCVAFPVARLVVRPLIGAVIGGVAGGALGLLAALPFHSERWRRVPAQGIHWSVGASRAGVSVGASFRL